MLTISVDPIAFAIGDIEIRWYGIMVALACLAVMAVTAKEAKRLGITHDVSGLFLWCIIGGYVGGRLVHVIDYWEYYVAHPREIVGFAGLAVYGTILGVILAAWIYVRVQRIAWSSMAGVGDAVAVATPLGLAIGRIGCVLNGCCFGKPSPFESFPGAVWYTPRDTIPPDYWLTALYPTQVYFVLWNLVVFATMWLLRDRLKPQGTLFLLFLCLYAAGDFTLRFLRINDPFLLGLHQGQVISLTILLVVTPLLVVRMLRYRRRPSAAAEVIEPDSPQNHES